MAFANKENIYALNLNVAPFKPKHPQFTKWNARQRSFKNQWSRSHPIHPDILIMQGFFYTGKADAVVCYHCGGGLRHLDRNDDIQKLHAILYGGCQFLFRLHSETTMMQMIDAPPTQLQWQKAFTPMETDFPLKQLRAKEAEVKRLKKKVNDVEAKTARAMNEMATKYKHIHNTLNQEIVQLRRELFQQSARAQCPVCQTNTRNIRLACGHSICNECLPMLQKCPCCRVIIAASQPLFL